MVTTCMHDEALHPGHNVLTASCPTRDALALIGDKWSVMVLLVLSRGALRFGKLRREIEGISQKMLTQTLRNLERNGLVRRRVFPTTPPSVEYSLTDLGDTLSDLMASLSRWAEVNIDAVLAARLAFDEQRETIAID